MLFRLRLTQVRPFNGGAPAPEDFRLDSEFVAVVRRIPCSGQLPFDRFHALNTAYGERFGFPFIICVRLTDKAGILAAMEQRLGNDRETEIATAIAEIGEIVRLRLRDLA